MHDSNARWLPRSRVIRVEFSFVLPVDATREQIEEWTRFELMQAGRCENGNPLLNHGCECIGEPLLTDTGKHLHEETAIEPLQPNDPPNCTARYRTTRWLSAEPYEGPSKYEQIERLRNEP